MTKMDKAMSVLRRSIPQVGGAFVVSIGMPVGFDIVLGINASSAQGAPRLWFDRRAMTSIDWITYPILDITEAPESIDVVLINSDVAWSGAGEPSIRPVAAARSQTRCSTQRCVHSPGAVLARPRDGRVVIPRNISLWKFSPTAVHVSIKKIRRLRRNRQ